jgi:hypothetical protein
MEIPLHGAVLGEALLSHTHSNPSDCFDGMDRAGRQQMSNQIDYQKIEQVSGNDGGLVGQEC